MDLTDISPGESKPSLSRLCILKSFIQLLLFMLLWQCQVRSQSEVLGSINLSQFLVFHWTVYLP